MAGEQFRVSTDALSTHCGALRTSGGDFPDILEAAGVGTSLSPLAFGVLCSFFTPPAIAIQGAGVAAIGALKALLDTSVEGVEACRVDYTERDRVIAAAMERLGER